MSMDSDYTDTGGNRRVSLRCDNWRKDRFSCVLALEFPSEIRFAAIIAVSAVASERATRRDASSKARAHSCKREREGKGEEGRE